MARWLTAWRLFLIAIDQLCGVWLRSWGYVWAGGAEPDPDETISSWVGRHAILRRRWALISEHLIDGLLGAGHCRASIEEKNMADKFATYQDVPDQPARNAVGVTLNDSTPLTDVPKAIFIGGAGATGTLVCRGVDDTADVTFVGLAAGSILPFRAVLLKATGSTVTNVLALY